MLAYSKTSSRLLKLLSLLLSIVTCVPHNKLNIYVAWVTDLLIIHTPKFRNVINILERFLGCVWDDGESRFPALIAANFQDERN